MSEQPVDVAEAPAPAKAPAKPRYRALRTQTFRGKTYTKGQLIPAADHLRVEALVRGRWIEPVT